MFVCNLKLNMKKILIICAIVIVAFALILEISGMIKNKSTSKFDYILNEDNFTEMLKLIHDNIDANVGKTIKLSGFVFRLPDFRSNYFVCGRNMLLDDDEKVVGFLCMYNGDLQLADSEWVEITGTIVKGYYSTDMPVIEISNIHKITAPSNTFVKTPDFLTN